MNVNALDGLAVLASKHIVRAYRLQHPVAALAVMADSFHLKPLMQTPQSSNRYLVLGLNRKEIKLCEGNRDAMDEIELHPEVPRTIADALGKELTEPRQTVASYGGVGHGHGGQESEVDVDAKCSFRAVDRAVLEHHSQPSGLPLVLAALPEHHHTFHDVSHNPFLLPESIDVYPDDLSSIDEFCQRAWQLIKPRYLARRAALAETFENATYHGLGSDELAQVAKVVVNEHVETLMIEARREIAGRIDASTGDIGFGDLRSPEG
jgi:hypothetical protein